MNNFLFRSSRLSKTLQDYKSSKVSRTKNFLFVCTVFYNILQTKLRTAVPFTLFNLCSDTNDVLIVNLLRKDSNN